MKKQQFINYMILLIVAVIVLSASNEWGKRLDSQIKQVEELNYRLDKLESDQDLMQLELNSIIINQAKTIQDVHITSYHPNDPYDSGTITASGLRVSDFTINDKGWFEYQGMLVVACATTNYNEDLILPNLYQRYELGSIITMVIDNVRYKAIVCDICGASYWEEDFQRYDIFVSDSESIIDTYGKVVVK